jgi:hypothetical protein
MFKYLFIILYIHIILYIFFIDENLKFISNFIILLFII